MKLKLLKNIFKISALLAALPTLAVAADKPQIALLMKTLSNEYFISMQQGAEEAAKQKNVDLIIQVAEKEDSTEQLVGLVENMIAKKVDAIIVTPNDSIAFIPAFQKAQKAGIPIIDLDVRLDAKAAEAAGLKFNYVGVDNFNGGYLEAKNLAEALGGKGNVAVLEGIPGVDNGEQRKGGALKAFAEYPEIKIVASQSANWETEQALNVTTNILTANPNINGIFAANDNMAIGAVTAVENAGLVGKVLVTGYDGIPLAIEYVKQGKMQNTIDQLPKKQVAIAIEHALKQINKQEIPAVYYVDPVVVDKEQSKNY
ncbi:monosaccharide-transporting ATPase [Aggregatibacter actinomycetemcomitans serotype e str. SC1083]|uniref:Monosaccharide-transporting ATPase n=1 Tax=Aggregatibacter actinomycetemcomitans serotype e str. SC1083 TaxID=907488 RepID=G4ABF1_AGGAC|nr:sugar ABC transporter substrate-binding protein [Aggregatibacter actinomycetemcomitans]EGY32492.1 monosaccharide-transporting ATPase [Aggregatibacter actinomycetemcomitans serotype e str. SC1083]KYK75148.1 monosaccharide-transporting ATPase [Aggregatibacter actinomycetemcomitans serotype e str. SA3096]KYK81657.1 monosaccharide-transporting ATPase [Aggregatibacter actinomycetemcomitans serotype e str. SC936]KYK95308.1 monosaccharide-transporting ATPase [Aggregatibacter actinomycetemcomitans s